MSSQGPNVPAGWYPDPTMVNTQRYWDGAAWTEHVQPAQNPSQFAPTPAQLAPTQQYGGPQQPMDGGHHSAPQYQPVGPAPGSAPYAPAPAKSGLSGFWKALIALAILAPLAIGGCAVALVAVGSTQADDPLVVEERQGLLEPDQPIELDDDPAEPPQPAPIDPVDSGDSGESSAAMGTRESPLPYNEAVPLTWSTFGDADGSVWATTIGPPRDITAEVLAENQFNSNPPEGIVFVGFDVELELLEAGKEPLAPGFNFSWEVLGGASAAAYRVGTVETGSFGCGVVPGSFDDFAEVFTTGVLTGTVCIPIPEEDLGHDNTQVALHFIDDTRAIFGN